VACAVKGTAEGSTRGDLRHRGGFKGASTSLPRVGYSTVVGRGAENLSPIMTFICPPHRAVPALLYDATGLPLIRSPRPHD
jgi:hypothetical protein